MAVATVSQFADGVLQSQLLDDAQRSEVQRLQSSARDTRAFAQDLLRREWLTAYQINQILKGRNDGLVLGPYVLLERIGEGGMGQVFKARQKMLNRLVALKVIRQQCLANPKVTLRFLREIRAAGQLNHPHIVRAYDADQINGTYYIAMEYIDGQDLAKMVKDGGPLPVDQACEYIRQAALGLQHAFERGMVHRDIKPANLLVARAVASDRRRSNGMIPRPLDLRSSGSALPRLDAVQHYPWGVIKILDMGLARYTDPFTGQASTHLTQVGSVMGTPEFIAPEQARDSHTSDIRADLYSLGCTLYYLLTGQPPFAHGTMTEKLLQHQLEAPPPLEPIRRQQMLAWNGPNGAAKVTEATLQVPQQVENVVCRLLAKQPKDRYQTPIELANELQTLVQQMADGKLPRVKRIKTMEAIALEEAVEPAALIETASLEPLVQLRSQPPRRGMWAALIALALAGLGGLTLLAIFTVAAVLMSRGSKTEAGVIEPAPNVKDKDAGKRPPRR